MIPGRHTSMNDLFEIYMCVLFDSELARREVMINQFPYESLFTTKDLIALMSRRAAGQGHMYPRWMPTVYNLNTDLPEFICHYQKRAERYTLC